MSKKRNTAIIRNENEGTRGAKRLGAETRARTVVMRHFESIDIKSALGTYNPK